MKHLGLTNKIVVMTNLSLKIQYHALDGQGGNVTQHFKQFFGLMGKFFVTF